MQIQRLIHEFIHKQHACFAITRLKSHGLEVPQKSRFSLGLTGNEELGQNIQLILDVEHCNKFLLKLISAIQPLNRTTDEE